MKARAALLIALRNFTRNGRRFLLLGIAAASGFFFVCTIQSLVAGLSQQIAIRGARYYGGHVIISRDEDLPADAAPAEEDGIIMEAISRSGLRPEAIAHRTHYGGDGILFANGESVLIRRIIGMDWSAESAAIGRLEFVAGNPGDMSDPFGALISEVTAKRTGARVGDQIVLQVSREGGAIDTISLRVKAIFREASIFGYYTVYMSRGVLNGALGLDPRYSATVGLYLSDYRSAEEAAARVREALAARPPAAAGLPLPAARYTAASMLGFMPEIKTMLEALTLISYGILGLLFIVIAVGILNMYRVMIYERTQEIGTMRAMGVQRAQVRVLILSEAFFLALCSIAAGLALSVIVLIGVSHIRLTGSAGLDIFLDRGHLTWVLNPDMIGTDAVLILLLTIVAALGPAHEAQTIEPVVALRAD